MPPAGGRYVAFADPSGGSQDSFTLAVAHRDTFGMAVLDLVRARRAPFDPDEVVTDFAEVIKTYGLTRITGDRYAGEWVVSRFREHGITYEQSKRTKNQIYIEILPAINGGRVTLLDHTRLRAQFEGLERRVARGGKDSIDHAPGGHDDLANAAAGALVAVVRPRQGVMIGRADRAADSEAPVDGRWSEYRPGALERGLSGGYGGSFSD